MSRSSEAAPAIVTLIGAQAGYDVAWGWAEQLDIKDFAKVGKITVLPGSRSWPDRESREIPGRTFEIEITIRKRHNARAGEFAPLEAISDVDTVAEAIGDLLMDRTSKVVGTGWQATCQSVDAEDLVDEELATFRTVVMRMTAKYRVDV